jgi:hypothetical protein
MLRSLTGLFMGVSPEQAAQAELIRLYDAYTAQATLVAGKRKTYELCQLRHQEAQQDHQSTTELYVAAMNIKDKNSKVITDLKNNFDLAEEVVQNRWLEVSAARKDLDAGILLMIQKENDKNRAEAKFEKTVRPHATMDAVPPKPDLMPVKATAKVDLQQEIQDIHEQTKNDVNSVMTGVGKVRIPENLLQHFNGNNREHISTLETEAVRQELSTLHANVKFAEMHEKLAKTLKSSSPPIIKVDPDFKEAFERVQTETGMDGYDFAGKRDAVGKLFCARFQGQQTVQKPMLDSELQEAILARRKQFI